MGLHWESKETKKSIHQQMNEWYEKETTNTTNINQSHLYMVMQPANS